MKKLLTLTLAAALLLGCLPGCGAGGGESSAPVSGDNAGTTAEGGDTAATTTGADTNTTETGDSSMTDSQSINTQGGGTTGTSTGVAADTTTAGNDKPGPATTTTKKKTTTAPPAAAGVEEAVSAYLNATPKVKYVSAYDPTSAGSGIKAITYDGATIGGQKTKVFAYIGFPKGASASGKVPAVVLVHGGGGHAFAEWVKIWNDRGYAAIAMDTTGFFPAKKGGDTGWESDPQSEWHYGLYGEFAESGYTNAPNNDEMSSSAKPLEQQWMYHSVVSTIMAHNILQADDRVNGKQIGITGISWGGIITSLAIGYDTAYAFAIPIYGSGYLDEAHSYQGTYFSAPATKKLWSAADRFNKVKFPVLWLGYSSDMPFSINSNSKSYLATKAAGAVLDMKVSWGHSHGSGWAPVDSYIFADSVIGKRGRMTAVTAEPTVKKNGDGTYAVTMTISPDAAATGVTATAAYIKAPLSYSSKNGGHPSMDQTWKASKCTVSADKTTLTCTLPKDAVDFYVLITTRTPNGKYDVSSQFVEGLK